MSPTIHDETWSRFDPTIALHATASTRRARAIRDSIAAGSSPVTTPASAIRRDGNGATQGQSDPGARRDEGRDRDLVEEEGVVEGRREAERDERRQQARREPVRAPRQADERGPGERDRERTGQ